MAEANQGLSPSRRRADLVSATRAWLRADFVIIAAGIVFLVSQGTAFAVTVGTAWAILSILGVSVNLLLGFTGLFSLAQVGFYGIGAYTVAILTSVPSSSYSASELIPVFGLSFFAALPLAVLLCGAVAAILAGVVCRFRGDVFLLVTFGFGVIVEGIFWNWMDLTRGAFGIRGIPKPALAGLVLDQPWKFLIMELILLVLVLLVSWFVVSGSFGRILKAIREDEEATQVFGYRTRGYKGVIWTLSAMIAGLAGALLAGWVRYVDPNSFTFSESLVVVMIVIVGGLGTIRGALVGALGYVLLGEVLRFLPFLSAEMVGYGRQAILGVLLVLLMLFRPEGIAGKYKL